MTFKLYNDSKRKKQIFKPLNAPHVTMYVCGPTIYDYAHLGHGRSLVAFDLLHRYLKYKSFQVNYVFNYTDIEDKMINRANEEHITVKQLADRFTQIYHEDYQKLNPLSPTHNPKATEHIPEMIELIKTLEKKSFTYPIDNDGLYFNVKKFKKYGQLSQQDLHELKAGARVDLKDKRSPHDFVLWKLAKPNEPSWDSPWGRGRPGWHIECSAMSMKYLGKTIDIHGGGQDLIFPHHEDEIAQSEAANGKPFAKYWLHNGFVTINGEKMSKSLNNFYTLRDIFKEYNPLAVRYLFLSIHYRMPINFTLESLQSAAKSLDKIQQAYFSIIDQKHSTKFGKKNLNINKYYKQLEKALDDDLNISPVLAVMFGLINQYYKHQQKLSPESLLQLEKFFQDIDTIFGILKHSREIIPLEIIQLAKARLEARKNKQWSESDQLRGKIKSLGYAIADTKEGYELKKL